MSTLPNLSLEILREIIEYAFLLATVTEAPNISGPRWGMEKFLTLRLVHTTFDQEVLSLLGKPISYISLYRRYRSPGLKQSELFAPCAAKILHRQASIQKIARPDLTLLHQVIECLEVSSKEVEQLKALEILFKQASDCIRDSRTPRLGPGFYYFVFLTDGYPWTWTTTEEEYEKLQNHLLPAAILLGMRRYYNKFICSHRSPSGLGQDSEYFGTPLHAAIKSHRNDLACTIIELMKKENLKEPRNCYKAAVVSRNLSMLQHLVDHAKPIILDERKSARGALIESAQLGYTDMGNCLFMHISRNYPKMINTDLLTELTHYASLCGNIEYLEFLVGQGANTMARPHPDVSRATPLMVAAWRGHTELLHWLIKRRKGVPIDDCACVLAALDGDQVDSMRILYQYGALDGLDDYHNPGYWDHFFFHGFLRNSNNVIRCVLLELSMLSLDDPRLRKWMAESCLDGRIGIFDVLLEAGLPVDVPLGAKITGSQRGARSWTALYFALASCHPSSKKIARKILGMGIERPVNGEFCDGIRFEEGMYQHSTSDKRYRSGMPYSLN